MDLSQESRIRALGTPTWTLKAAPLWLVFIFGTLAVVVAVLATIPFFQDQQFSVRMVAPGLVALLMLWNVTRMARSRVHVYREGIVLVRPHWFGISETFVSFESIREVAVSFQKRNFFHLKILKRDDNLEKFGPAAGRGNVFEFLSHMEKLMGRLVLEESTMIWFRKRQQKEAAQQQR